MGARRSRRPKRFSHTVGHWLGLFLLEGLAVGLILYLIAAEANRAPSPITPATSTAGLANHPQSATAPTLFIKP